MGMKTLGRALAVSALLALSACGTQTSGPEAADDPTPTAPTSPSSPEPTPSATASTAEPTDADPVTVLTLQGLPEGSPPQVPYLALAGGTWSLVEPDGTTRPLDREYAAFAPMGRRAGGHDVRRRPHRRRRPRR